MPVEYYDGDRYARHSEIETVHQDRDCPEIAGDDSATRYAPDDADKCPECYPLGNDSNTCAGTTADGSACTREVDPQVTYCFQHRD